MTRTTAGLAALAGFLAILAVPPALRAQAAESASVVVTIRVEPVAHVDFPDGFDFILEVPDKKNKWAFIKPVVIPFRIRGNALAAISVRPDEFMQIAAGPFLGEAFKEGGDRHKNQTGKGHEKKKGKGHLKDSNDEMIGYNVIVQFPVPSWLFADLGDWDGFGSWLEGFASLPGLDGQGTPLLTADVTQGGGGALGMIYIVAKREWTAESKAAPSGEYRGAVQVTVTADQQ